MLLQIITQINSIKYKFGFRSKSDASIQWYFKSNPISKIFEKINDTSIYDIYLDYTSSNPAIAISSLTGAQIPLNNLNSEPGYISVLQIYED